MFWGSSAKSLFDSLKLAFPIMLSKPFNSELWSLSYETERSRLISFATLSLTLSNSSNARSF
jgi:hypothetical protein